MNNITSLALELESDGERHVSEMKLIGVPLMNDLKMINTRKTGKTTSSAGRFIPYLLDLVAIQVQARELFSTIFPAGRFFYDS